MGTPYFKISLYAESSSLTLTSFLCIQQNTISCLNNFFHDNQKTGKLFSWKFSPIPVSPYTFLTEEEYKDFKYSRDPSSLSLLLYSARDNQNSVVNCI